MVRDLCRRLRHACRSPSVGKRLPGPFAAPGRGYGQVIADPAVWLATPSHCLHRPHLGSLSLGDGDGAKAHHLGVVAPGDIALAEAVEVIDDIGVELLELVDI